MLFRLGTLGKSALAVWAYSDVGWNTVPGGGGYSWRGSSRAEQPIAAPASRTSYLVGMVLIGGRLWWCSRVWSQNVVPLV